MHTLPTRPEINISRETELVLSVFTAQGQAGQWGRGPLEEPHLWATALAGTASDLLCTSERVPAPLGGLLQALEGLLSLGLALPTAWFRLWFLSCKSWSLLPPP